MMPAIIAGRQATKDAITTTAADALMRRQQRFMKTANAPPRGVERRFAAPQRAVQGFGYSTPNLSVARTAL
jgi:hypothetical protein